MVTSWGYAALGAIGLGIAGRASVWFAIALVWIGVVFWLIRVTRNLRDQRQRDEAAEAKAESDAGKPPAAVR